ncbi:MAG: hypothetical protein E6J47_07385 [Chloroflexi bacterium]|nr:MAG: hypothetical protein E6J47_07385 [Chloroflexota bacterium]
MVTLVDGEHEQGVALVDAVSGEAGEERTEGLVVALQLVDVGLLPGTKGDVLLAGDPVVVVGIGDVAVGDRDARLLHLCDVTEGVGREVAIEPGEAHVVGGVLDDVAIEVEHRPIRADGRSHVLGPEEAVEPGIAARFLRQHVRLAVVGRRAELVAGGTVNRHADEIGERLAGIRDHLGGLRRVRPEDGRDVDGGVLEHDITGRERPNAASRPGVGHPRRRRVHTGLGDHVVRGVERRRVPSAGRREDRRGPVGERDPAVGEPGSIGPVVAERVRDRLTMLVGVDTRQRAHDAARGMRDEHRVVVGQERPVALDEVEQVRHLLQV